MKHAFRPLALLLLVLTLAVSLAACKANASGPSGTTRTVAASEFKFDPATVTVPVGAPVTISLQNKGTVIHDFNVEGLDQPFMVTADPGKTASGTFTPTKAGTFKVVCTQPAHEQSGMVGQLVVQ